MENNITYCGKYYLGALGDFTAEWWTEKEWEEHRKYVEELKTKGEYLKEVECCITLQNCPELDNPSIDFGNKKSTPEFLIFDIYGE